MSNREETKHTKETMKAYVITSGVIFCLVTIAHIVRMFVEPHVIKEPFYNFLTVLAAGLSVWAWRLARSQAPPGNALPRGSAS